MKTSLRLMVASLLVLANVSWPAGSVAASGLNTEKLKEVRARMQGFVDEGVIAGAVTLVARNGEVGDVAAVGFSDLQARKPMEEDAMFWIASMTKPITAVAVLMLQDEGKLSVNDPVEKHLPEFKGQWLVESQTNTAMCVKRPARAITIRDLLTHTSGLDEMPAPRGDCTLAELVTGHSQRALRFEPGSKWSYCNSGINTLGRIVEVASGQEFAEFLEKRIFRPLGMKDTSFWPTALQLKRVARSYQPAAEGKGLEETGIFLFKAELTNRDRTPHAAGGLFSTARDYYRFCQMMLNLGIWSGKRMLSKEAVAELTRTQTGDLKTGFTEGMSFGYGFGVVKEPTGVTSMLSAGSFGHGGAYGTQAWIDPQKEMVFILMIQRAKLPNADASDIRRVFQEEAVSAIIKPL